MNVKAAFSKKNRMICCKECRFVGTTNTLGTYHHTEKRNYFMTRKLYVICLVVLIYTIAINGRPSSQSQLSDEMTVIMDRFCEVNRMAYNDSLIDAYLSL